jgi:hypothetical protein
VGIGDFFEKFQIFLKEKIDFDLYEKNHLSDAKHSTI